MDIPGANDLLTSYIEYFKSLDNTGKCAIGLLTFGSLIAIKTIAIEAIKMSPFGKIFRMFTGISADRDHRRPNDA